VLSPHGHNSKSFKLTALISYWLSLFTCMLARLRLIAFDHPSNCVRIDGFRGISCEASVRIPLSTAIEHKAFQCSWLSYWRAGTFLGYQEQSLSQRRRSLQNSSSRLRDCDVIGSVRVTGKPDYTAIPFARRGIARHVRKSA
jgi:hypothetical protein